MKQRVRTLERFPFEPTFKFKKPPHGGARKGAGRKPAKLDMAAVRKQREDGMSYAKIGEFWGVTGQTIQTRIDKENRKLWDTESTVVETETSLSSTENTGS